MSDPDMMCDVLVIGSGPGGCTAALFAARAALKTVMISPTELSGMMAHAPIVGNFPGQVEPLPGREILAKIRRQALNAGAVHLLEPAVGVDFSNEEELLVYAGMHIHHAQAVIIATGAMSPSQKVPGEEQFEGRGVARCVACDGPLFESQDVLVVGQDAQAGEEALTLARIASHVTVVMPTAAAALGEDLHAALQGQANVTIEAGLKLTEILGEDRVTGATFADQSGEPRTLEAAGIFLYTRGSAPATDFLMGAVETDAKGFIKTDSVGQTSVPRVFAVGDVRSKEARQMVLAAAEGCLAALTAERLIHRRERMRLDRGNA